MHKKSWDNDFLKNMFLLRGVQKGALPTLLAKGRCIKLLHSLTLVYHLLIHPPYTAKGGIKVKAKPPLIKKKLTIQTLS